MRDKRTPKDVCGEATLGTEESGHCREVETIVNVWTVHQKNGHCREMAVSGALAVYYYYQHSYMDSMCIFNVFSDQAFFLGCLAFT